MNPSPFVISRELTFNSVEVELIRRWGLGNMPRAFRRHPARVLRCFVKSWWNLYHETHCAATRTNRTYWKRSQDLPAPTLDSPGLVSALLRIRALILLEALDGFRPIRSGEESALVGLSILIHYYAEAEGTK